MAILKVKGSWPVSNLKGWIKKFKDVESADAVAWMSNRDFEPPEMTKEEKAAAREAKRNALKLEKALAKEAKKNEEAHNA